MRAVILVAALSLSPFATAETVIGRASVIDGDTIEIRGDRIRLAAIDAPERGQNCRDAKNATYRCGSAASFALADRIGAANVRCEGSRRDRFGRLIAECFLGRESLNGWMVEQGWALAYRRYGGERHAAAEARARAAKRGVWQGEFTPPEAHRRGQRG